MAVAAESSNSLEIEECPLNGPVLNKIFYVDLFNRINYPLTTQLESLLLNKLFTNLKLQKHRRILFC